MKAERRHELQTNALADWLAKNMKKVQPHANTILIGTLLVVGAIVAIVVLSGRSSDNSASGWNDYYEATLIDDEEKRITELEGVAEKNPDKAPGLWAKLLAAEGRLQRGSVVYFKNRTEGRPDLESAQSDFEAVIAGGAKLPKSEREWLLQRAHWGLGRTYETLAMPDEAETQYDTLAKTWPDAPLGKAAAEKSRQVSLMADWYKWYASVDPESIKPSATQEGFPGFNQGRIPMERPNEDGTVPGFDPANPLSFPGVGDIDLGLGSDTDDTTTDDTTTDDPPAGDDAGDNGNATGDSQPEGETTQPDDTSSESTPSEGSAPTAPEGDDAGDQGEATDAGTAEPSDEQP